ncbi:MAG TPA: hypothetical protein VGD33_05365 [Chitinophagaceae bacterium]
MKEDVNKGINTDTAKLSKIGSKNKLQREAAKKAIGRLATRFSAVGGAASAGYDIGTALNKKFKLSEKIANTAMDIKNEYKTRVANIRKGKKK